MPGLSASVLLSAQARQLLVFGKSASEEPDQHRESHRDTSGRDQRPSVPAAHLVARYTPSLVFDQAPLPAREAGNQPGREPSSSASEPMSTEPENVTSGTCRTSSLDHRAERQKASGEMSGRGFATSSACPTTGSNRVTLIQARARTAVTSLELEDRARQPIGRGSGNRPGTAPGP